MKFKDKVVFITGGGSGIGKASAMAFSEGGASVYLVDWDEDSAKRVSEEIVQSGGKSHYRVCDVSQYTEVVSTVKDCEKHFGKIDIAVNSAGIGGDIKRTGEYDIDSWHKVINVNQHGVFYSMREELSVMKKQGHGVVVNVSSMAGLRGLAHHIAYTASKHAVLGMTRSAALEYAKSSIRVNAVCPVFTESPLLDLLIQDNVEIEKKLLSTIPVGRFGKVADIANAILWLSQDESEFITGLCLPVDGGQMA